MKITLEKFIKNNEHGLFLLDSPTGFGKTTAVLNILKEYLNGQNFQDIERMFFVTNLITNLPYTDLLKQLTEEEQSCCFKARATVEYVLKHFSDIEINNNEITGSQEYKKLKNDIEIYNFLKQERQKAQDEQKNYSGIQKSLKSFEIKIANDSEPAFRKFIKAKFFYNQSVIEKKKFIKENGWFKLLYPICEIEKYKVIFLTTKKFISPIDIFTRMPFYAYCDSITDNSVVFIDEFDSTKKILLSQIIEDGLQNKIDVIKLFLDLHYALQNIKIPKRLFNTTIYNKEKVESEKWYSTESHFEYNKKIFNEKYIKYQIDFLLKSVDFEYKKAFLFDDGKYFNIFKDSSKKFIYTKVDDKESQLSLYGNTYESGNTQINFIIKDITWCIDNLVKSIFYIANNFLYYKNSTKSKEETKFTLEESIFSVIDLFNLSDDEKKYIFDLIAKGDFVVHGEIDAIECRKGFNFTEIEDSNSHDMKSIVHVYNFDTTPEDVIVKLATKGLVIGISATAKIATCIGNYDLKYIKKELKEKYIDIDDIDEKRITDDFCLMKKELKTQRKIHIEVIDNLSVFSDKEKCEKLINILFEGDLREKYQSILRGIKDARHYYFFIELKLGYLYKEIGTKDIYSFIAFLNRFPRENGDLSSSELDGIFEDISKAYYFERFDYVIIEAANFDDEIKKVHINLQTGKKVMILTTYQTIGSGKNIQYTIPLLLDNIVLHAKDDTRNTKDFDGVYLLTPTNLTQDLNYYTENKYNDLANFLFQQEYLYQNKFLSYYQMRNNIINGFRTIFFGEKNNNYIKNPDVYLHTAQIIIQAIGRLCRCRNKNKNTYIYADKEVIERIDYIKTELSNSIYNDEFLALMEYKIEEGDNEQLLAYSKQSKDVFGIITNAAYTIRNTLENVRAWQELRDFVLKNPTTNNPPEYYKRLYFEFATGYSGYAYKFDNRYNLIDIKFDGRYDMEQVSEQMCDLPLMLSIPCVAKLFEDNKYSCIWKRANYIMSPSLYKQVYLGALGEVVGKCILENQLGWDLKELENVVFYEYFDYQIGNFYFDFKHWNEFRVDNDKYVKKIENKLCKIKGAKCFIINIVKRTEAQPKENIGETVVQIPYLIDGDTGKLNEEAIEYIAEMINL